MTNLKQNEISDIVTCEDKFNSLKIFYFGGSVLEDPYKCATERAYRDFQRTIRFNKPISGRNYNKQEDDEIKEIRKEISSYIKSQISGFMMGNQDFVQEQFDELHMKICNEIISKYKSKAQFYYGQAQKWLNMTMKYLLILDDENVLKLEPFLHVPIDNNILHIAYSLLDAPKQTTAWSRWNCDNYLRYQTLIRKKIEERGLSPIVWEIQNWKK